MPQAIEQAIGIFGFPAVVALATSLFLTWLPIRLAAAGKLERFVVPSAVAIGYLCGYLVLPRSWAALVPQENQAWQWLPYLSLSAAACTASVPTSSRPAVWILPMLALAAIAFAVLAPSWPVYGFTRRPLGLFVAVYLMAIGLPLQRLPTRLLNRWFLPLLIVVSVISALAIGAMVSMRLAQLAALAASALAGSWIASLSGTTASDSTLRRLIPVFATLVGGAGWLACVEPDPPRPMLLAFPFLPLALWIVSAARLPFARRQIG